MTKGVGVLGIYVHDQDEALDFYVNKLGFVVHADYSNGDYRWLTVKHPNQPSFELGLFVPQEPVLDAATAQTMREMVAKGAMPPLVLLVEDCRDAYERLHAKGVEFTQEPIARFGGVDANFRDPSGNAWKMVEARG
jgi:catechol 2,3-dioxygenase-like lactoylglutathione lyase family enzyme